MRRNYTKDLINAELGVTDIPFDRAITDQPGSRLAPRAILMASSLQTFDPPYGWAVYPFSENTTIDYGDLAFDYAKTSLICKRGKNSYKRRVKCWYCNFGNRWCSLHIFSYTSGLSRKI